LCSRYWASRQATLARKGSRIAGFGVLRRVDYSWADVWAVGDGTRALLYQPNFVSGSLWTYDGNDFFVVSAVFGAVAFELADASARNDEFDL